MNCSRGELNSVLRYIAHCNCEYAKEHNARIPQGIKVSKLELTHIHQSEQKNKRDNGMT